MPDTEVVVLEYLLMVLMEVIYHKGNGWIRGKDED